LLASGTRNLLLVLRGEYEIPFIRRVAGELAPRCVIVPWLAQAPVGSDGLAQLEK
jgi:arsenite-transporting ATPase